MKRKRTRLQIVRDLLGNFAQLSIIRDFDVGLRELVGTFLCGEMKRKLTPTTEKEWGIFFK